MRLGHITPKNFGDMTSNMYMCDTNDVRNFQIAKGNTGLPGSFSEWEPPDSISNSAVKLYSADGSVGSPHVRVGHHQLKYLKALYWAFFI